MLEDKGFQNFVKQLNPSYVLPSLKTVSATYIPALYEKRLTNTREKVKRYPQYVHYYGLLDKEFIHHNILLDCYVLTKRHTSVNLATELQKVTTEWGVNNRILIAISDNAANIGSAIVDHLEWPYFGCFAHTLNLIVTAALQEKNVQPLITKIQTASKNGSF